MIFAKTNVLVDVAFALAWLEAYYVEIIPWPCPKF
jgi:hypothetical protein